MALYSNNNQGTVRDNILHPTFSIELVCSISTRKTACAIARSHSVPGLICQETSKILMFGEERGLC